MLLKSYKKELFLPECNPRFQSLHCIARLDEDIGEVIPYLNSELGGYQYTVDPPSVTFKHHGKLITVHPRQIAINALKDEDEANRILEWLKDEINAIWQKRAQIQPKYEGMRKPNIVEILRYLPKTNCKKCGLATCMLFAVQLSEGGRTPEQCPEIRENALEKLKSYLLPYAKYFD